MKEFLLSFDNTQQKRQRELSVEYRTYSIRNKYLFVYQRDGISLDVEYFKDLVSFSKKPTRSSLLYLEWVTHVEPIRLQNHMVRIQSNKPFLFLPVTTLVKVSMRKNIVLFNQSVDADRVFNRYVAKFENFLIEPKDKKYINIPKNLFLNDLKQNKTEIFQNNFYFKDSILNSFENINLESSHAKFGHTFEDIMTQISHERFLNEFDILFLSREYITNSFQTLPMSVDIKAIISDEPMQSLHRGSQLGFIIKRFMAKNITNAILHTNFFNETILGYPEQRYLDSFDIINVHVPYRIWNVFENVTVYSANNRILNDFQINLYQKANQINTSKFESIYINAPAKHITEYEFSGLKFVHERIINDFSFNDMVYKSLPYSASDYGEVISGDKNDSLYASYFNNESFIRKYAEYVQTQDYIPTGIKGNQNVYVSDDHYNAIKNLNGQATVPSYDMISKYYSNMFVQDQYNFINKYNMYLAAFNSFDQSLNKYHMDLYKYHTEAFINGIRKDINVYHTETNLIKIRNGLMFNQFIDFATRNAAEVFYERTEEFISKYNTGFALFDTYTDLNDSSREIGLLYTGFFTGKSSNEAVYNNALLDINKLLNEVFITTNSEYMQKFIRQMFMEHSDVSMLKEYREASIETDYIHDIVKNYLPLMLGAGSSQTIIAVNKINKTMFTKDLLNFVSKQRGNIFLDSSTDTVFADKGIRNIFSLDNLFCDKLSRDTSFIGFINESVIKKQINTWFVNEDIFVNKDSSATSITPHDAYVTALERPVYISDQLWVNKLAQDIAYIGDQETFDKVHSIFENDTFVPFDKYVVAQYFDQIEWFTMIKQVFFYQEESLVKQYKAFSQQKEDVFVDRPIGLLGLLPTGQSLDIERFLYMTQIDQIARVNNFPLAFYEQYFLTRDMSLDILPSMGEIHKIIKEANITTDATLDWAWTYEEDEPFDDPFKIDELLLPENDSRYEDFENIIFNRATGKPRNPIQVIDDYTFIAKYPVHYPIKDEDGENAYKDVAVEYLDVRTSIMKKVFLGYYQLWQDHIFEFSRMTIPQSAKKILDYLYAWIFMNFSEEDIPEALRTFRLVRWYLERGIIETSEYCITVNPKPLTSGPMNTTQLNIPTDLYPTDGSTPNNTMYVDPSIHVIRNNQNMLHHEAHLTIYIDNKKETLISFSLHTLTPVYIILNEGLDNEQTIDSITIPTTGKMVYNIPYTGDVNTFTIKKLGVDNNDNEFYIGNISIDDLDYKNADLDIEFNPSKVQGNKVLNYVSQKVIAYANLLIENEVTIGELVKGNIHLSEVYEHLVEYWNLHHQNKDKGKRLTIKRT